MDVIITQENPILIKAEVTVPWEKVAPHQEQALVEIRKHAQVPGFRKGKAPTALLKKRFRQQIIAEISQSLLPTDMDAWIKEKKVRAVGTPRLLELDLVDNQHLHYVTQIDVKPEFELEEWRGLEVETLKITASDKDVDEAIEADIAAASKSQTITDRPAEAGDTVKIALTALDSVSNESLTDLESYVVELGSEEAHRELGERLTGLESGEDLAFEFDAPEDDQFENWRGHRVKCFVEVLEITRKQTPQLDDAFAQARGAEDLADYREKVRQRLLDEGRHREDNRVEYALMQQLVKPYKFDVPRDMIQAEAEGLVEAQFGQYLRVFQQQKQKVPRDLMEQMLQMQLPAAFQKVYAGLVLEKIAAELGLEVSAEERNEELALHLPSTEFKTVEELASHVEKIGNMSGVDNVIKTRKAIEAIKAAAKLKEVDELTKPPEHDHDHDHDHHDHDHDHHGHDHHHHHHDNDHQHDHDDRVGGLAEEEAAPAAASAPAEPAETAPAKKKAAAKPKKAKPAAEAEAKPATEAEAKPKANAKSAAKAKPAAETKAKTTKKKPKKTENED